MSLWFLIFGVIYYWSGNRRVLGFRFQELVIWSFSELVIWEPIPAEGFVALGCVVGTGPTPPPLHQVRRYIRVLGFRVLGFRV